MSRTTVRIVTIALVAVAGLLGQSLVASTKVVVGPNTCMPAYPHYADIQTAVSSVPLNTIVMVCPGTYAQQINITQPITLQGVTDGTGNAAVITVPAAGLVQNGTSNSFGPVAVQLLIHNTVGVTIKDLVVDGNGGNCPAGSNRNVGIGVFDVGTPNDGTAAARIDSVVVRNDTTCFGDGILGDTSYITITNSEIHDVNQTAIDAYSAKYSITNNSIQRASLYGIVLVAANGTLVSGNSISDGAYAGILTENASNGATITKNTLLNNVYVGIWSYFAYQQTITQNVVSNSWWPMTVTGGYQCVVQYNTLKNSFLDGLLDYSSFGGNNITKNTVNEALYGIFTDNSVSGDVLVPNYLFNVVITVDPNPTQGPGVPPQG